VWICQPSRARAPPSTETSVRTETPWLRAARRKPFNSASTSIAQLVGS
jgi:hypothetical protein